MFGLGSESSIVQHGNKDYLLKFNPISETQRRLTKQNTWFDDGGIHADVLEGLLL